MKGGGFMSGIFVILLFIVGAVIFGGMGFIIQTAFRKAKKPFAKFIPLAVLFAILVCMLIKPVFFFYYVAVGFAAVGAAVCLVISKKGE